MNQHKNIRFLQTLDIFFQVCQEVVRDSESAERQKCHCLGVTNTAIQNSLSLYGFSSSAARPSLDGSFDLMFDCNASNICYITRLKPSY